MSSGKAEGFALDSKVLDFIPRASSSLDLYTKARSGIPRGLWSIAKVSIFLLIKLP